MQLRYEARFKGSKDNSDDEFKFEGVAAVEGGRSVVPLSTVVQNEHGKANGAIRRRSLLVGIRLVGSDDLTDKERWDEDRVKEAEVIRKAHAGLDAPKK
jgi:hypothetical protein